MSLHNAIAGNEAFLQARGVLFEDNFGAPPTAQVAADYNAAVGVFEFTADIPRVIFDFFPGGSLPGILVIDTCTMEIVYKANSFNLQEILVAADGVDD